MLKQRQANFTNSSQSPQITVWQKHFLLYRVAIQIMKGDAHNARRSCSPCRRWRRCLDRRQGCCGHLGSPSRPRGGCLNRRGRSC